MKIAVVGAGVSGLMCARELARAGSSVHIFDKGRRPAGRLSTRRDSGVAFDHGAQYFTVRDPAFADAVARWRELRVVAPWAGRIVVLGEDPPSPPRPPTTRYVGVPTMSAIGRHLADGLDVRARVRIESIKRVGTQWRLRDDEARDVGDYEAVAVAVPSAQAVPLLAGAPDLGVAAARAAMAPCWAVMLVPESPLGLPFDGAFIHGQAVGWAARQDSKPGRAPIEAWVLHATAQWTKAHWEMPSSGVIDALCEAFAASAGISPIKVSRSTAHRWRYALPTLPTDSRCLVDSALKIGACGDWCGGPRLEGAYLSGIELARRLRQSV